MPTRDMQKSMLLLLYNGHNLQMLSVFMFPSKQFDGDGPTKIQRRREQHADDLNEAVFDVARGCIFDAVDGAGDGCVPHLKLKPGCG